MLKRLTIPRKYKWRPICKDEKKDKEKKSTLRKTGASWRNQLSRKRISADGATGKLNGPSPLKFSFRRRKRRAPLNAAYRSSPPTSPIHGRTRTVQTRVKKKITQLDPITNPDVSLSGASRIQLIRGSDLRLSGHFRHLEPS